MEVQIIKQVRSGIGKPMEEDAFLARTVELPFAPFVGLQLLDDGKFYAELTVVTYNLSDRDFLCWSTIDDRLSRFKSEDTMEPYCTRPLAELVAEWEAKGWRRIPYVTINNIQEDP